MERVRGGGPVYGVLGVGAIASAMVRGLRAGGDATPVVLSPRGAGTAAALAERLEGVRVAAGNQEVLDRADVILLCLRPQDLEAALADVRFDERHRVLSVVATVPLARLRALVAPATVIARAVPLVAVAEGRGPTPVHPAHPLATALFHPLGGVLEVDDEGAFEAIQVASATIAAHFAYLDAITSWLAASGIPRPGAERFVASMFAGLTTMLEADAPDFEALAREHATPGGLNERFRNALTDAGTFAAIPRALDDLRR